MSVLTHPPPDVTRLLDEELIIKQARRRQRRRWLFAGLLVVLVAASGLIVAEAMGGHGKTGRTTGSGDNGSSGNASPINGAGGGTTAVRIGGGPTSIYFLNSQEGWIATGCGGFCYQTRPTIVRTADGGGTWQVITGPDIGSVPFSETTWMALGGQTEVRFLDARHGFYAQVGELWITENAGTSWRLAKLSGPVVSFATMGQSAWALVSGCPRFPLSCSQIDLFRWSATSPEWIRSSQTFTTAGGQPTDAALTAAGPSLFIAVPGHQYRIAADGRATSVSTACWAIEGPPTPGQLVGICEPGGGGDASAVRFGSSVDQGKGWRPTVGGPPSQSRYDWAGAATTNGRGTLWFVVGGGTLWRTSPGSADWQRVYATPPGSDEELYPVVFASPTVGFMGESGNETVRLLKTTNGGLTWAPVGEGLPSGSRMELPSSR